MDKYLSCSDVARTQQKKIDLGLLNVTKSTTTKMVVTVLVKAS